MRTCNIVSHSYEVVEARFLESTEHIVDCRVGKTDNQNSLLHLCKNAYEYNYGCCFTRAWNPKNHMIVLGHYRFKHRLLLLFIEDLKFMTEALMEIIECLDRRCLRCLEIDYRVTHFLEIFDHAKREDVIAHDRVAEC